MHHPDNESNKKITEDELNQSVTIVIELTQNITDTDIIIYMF